MEEVGSCWCHWATQVRPHTANCQCQSPRGPLLVITLSFLSSNPTCLSFALWHFPCFWFSSGLPVRFFQKGTLEGDRKPGGEETTSSFFSICVLCLSTSPPQRYQLPDPSSEAWVPLKGRFSKLLGTSNLFPLILCPWNGSFLLCYCFRVTQYFPFAFLVLQDLFNQLLMIRCPCYRTGLGQINWKEFPFRHQECNVLSCTSGSGSNSLCGWLTELGFSDDLHSLRWRCRTFPHVRQM